MSSKPKEPASPQAKLGSADEDEKERGLSQSDDETGNEFTDEQTEDKVHEGAKGKGHEEAKGQTSSVSSSPKVEPEVTEFFSKKDGYESPKSGSSSGSSSGRPSYLSFKDFDTKGKDDASKVTPNTDLAVLTEGDDEEYETDAELEASEGEDEELQGLLVLDQAFGDQEGLNEEQALEEFESESWNWTVEEGAEYDSDAETESEYETDGDQDHLAEIHAWLDNKSIEYLADNRSKFSTYALAEEEEGEGGDEVVLGQNSQEDLPTREHEQTSGIEKELTFSYEPMEVSLNCKSKDPKAKPGSHSQSPFQYESNTERVMDRCPSIESVMRQYGAVDVHFYLFPGKRMISRDCRLDSTIYQLKKAISRFVRVPTMRLDLRRKRSLVADNKTLEQLGGKAGKKMRFLVEINNRLPGNMTLHIMGGDVFVPEPDTRRKVVFLVGKKSIPREMEMVIVHPKGPKANLGGFIDSQKGKSYRHAATQMEVFDDKEWVKSHLHQACQAFNTEDFSVQTMSDKCVQMDRSDYYMNPDKDKIIYPKPYHDCDYVKEKQDAAAIIVQRYWRRWLAKKERKNRLEGLVKRVRWAELIRQGRLDQRLQIMMEELARQENPTSLLDLELLYRAINSWREGEEAYVKANRWGAERKAALACLTEMEADLLLELERTKIRIVENGREDNTNREFDKMSQPKRWLGTKTGTFVSYDTGGRVKARRLHDIYKELLAPVPNTPEGTQERVELLQKLSGLVSKKQNTKTEMIADLISRELRFLHVSASSTLFAGVRRRIASTFFCLCKDPNFNPEARRIEKIPYETSKLRKDMIQCKGCRRMQYRDEFTIIKGTTLTSRCHTCMGLYRTAILRIDLNLYRQMLKELRRDEFEAGVINSVAFLIDAFDMRFLVEQIWHAQSALSGIDNRYLLRLCRWIKKDPWAPWNSVLLTEEEAVAHIQLEDLDAAYRDTFFHKVFVKQATAKTYFEGLAKFAVGLDARIAENCQNAADSHKQALELKNRWQKKAKAVKVFSVLTVRT